MVRITELFFDDRAVLDPRISRSRMSSSRIWILAILDSRIWIVADLKFSDLEFSDLEFSDARDFS